MIRARRPAAVVLAADINGLGVTRSLHAAGVSTIVVATKADDPVLESRLPSRRLVASAGQGQDRMAALLATLAGIDEARPVLIPTSDFFVAFMARNRAALAARFALCMPATATLEALLDKQRQSELVEAIGIPTPRTIRRLDQEAGARLEALGLPAIFKPRSFAERALLSRKTVLVRNHEERTTFLARFRHALPGLIAQEVIPGSDDQLWVCNCTFDHRHALVAAFTFRRLRMCPAHYGVTSYAVSASNPAVVELVAELGRALKYVGPAMVEFKFDVRDGLYKFIEINPRLGMCNAFDTRCGVDNVFCTYQLALGEPVAPQTGVQRDGVMFLSLIDDLQSRREEGQSLLSALGEYAQSLNRRHVGAYFSVRDPRPAAVVGLRAARQVLAALRRRLARLPAGEPEGAALTAKTGGGAQEAA